MGGRQYKFISRLRIDGAAAQEPRQCEGERRESRKNDVPLSARVSSAVCSRAISSVAVWVLASSGRGKTEIRRHGFGLPFLVVVVKGVELRQLSTSRPSRRVSGRVVGREEGGEVAAGGWTSTAVETDACITAEEKGHQRGSALDKWARAGGGDGARSKADCCLQVRNCSRWAGGWSLWAYDVLFFFREEERMGSMTILDEGLILEGVCLLGVVRRVCSGGCWCWC